MFSIDLSLSVGRPATASGIPTGGPDGVIQTEAADFLQVEDGKYLAFD